MTDSDNRSKPESPGNVAYPVFYMFAVTFVAAGVLIGLSRFTAQRVEANREVLFEKAVLMALGLRTDERAQPSAIHRIFVERVAPPMDSTAGAYRLMGGGRVTAYALPVEGQGFWDVIKGVAGIEAEGGRLLGLAFYQQSETPGLGAEIVKDPFRVQFRGLKLADGDAPLRFKPVGSETGEGEVHAITGATQTCTRLEKILNEVIGRWRRQMGFSPKQAAKMSMAAEQKQT